MQRRNFLCDAFSSETNIEPYGSGQACKLHLIPGRFLLQFSPESLIYGFAEEEFMKKQIRELFPEIAQIKDEKLRQQVVSTWEEAIREGGWQIDDLQTIPFTLLIPDCRIDLITHTRGVTQTAIQVAGVLIDSYGDRVKIDSDVLIAGAILHDVGKVAEYVREGDKVVKSKSGKLLRHPFSGSALAYKHGLSQEVIHMIATHAKEGDGGHRTTEAMIVHYADFINFESLGGKV